MKPSVKIMALFALTWLAMAPAFASDRVAGPFPERAFTCVGTYQYQDFAISISGSAIGNQRGVVQEERAVTVTNLKTAAVANEKARCVIDYGTGALECRGSNTLGTLRVADIYLYNEFRTDSDFLLGTVVGVASPGQAELRLAGRYGWPERANLKVDCDFYDNLKPRR